MAGRAVSSWSIFVGTACAAVVGLSGSSHAAAPAPSCFPKGSKTVAVTKTARVFKTRRGMYGCLLEAGRARRLDPDNWDKREYSVDAFPPYRFNGPYLAYHREVSQGCGPDVCQWTEVAVVDLRPTKPLLLQRRFSGSDETVGPFVRNEPDALNAEAFITDLVLLRDGTVGWIECEGDPYFHCDKHAEPQEKAQTSVFTAVPGERARRKLDEGAGIDKRSLRWSGGEWHWRNAGQPRSATPACRANGCGLAPGDP